MDFIRKNDAAGVVGAEFVFRIHKDQPTVCCHLLPAREQRKRDARDFVPLRRRQQTRPDDLRRGQRCVMATVEGL